MNLKQTSGLSTHYVIRVRQVLLSLCLIAISTLPVQGQSGNTKSSTASKSLKKLYATMRGERYLDAFKRAESILKTGQPNERLQAGLVFGRILFSLDKTTEAATYLKKMQSLKLAKEDDQQLLKVYAAWLLAQQGKQDESVAALKAMLKRGLPMASTAEAADVLALIYLKKKDPKKADKVVKFGLQLLKYHGLKTPYIAQILRNRIKQRKSGVTPETGEAIALYKKGEALRKAEKFVEAGKVFTGLQKKYPKNKWSHAAGFQIGQCLVGLKSIKEAKRHWAKFLKLSPSGPWRGQAHHGLIEIAIRQELNLASARQRLNLATSVLSGTLPNNSQDSWNKITLELRLQTGLLAFAENDFVTAVDALQKAHKLARKNSPVYKFLPALIADCQKKQTLLPQELALSEGAKTKKAKKGRLNPKQLNALITLAVLENRLERFQQSVDLIDRIANTGQFKKTEATSYALFLKGRALHGLGKKENGQYLDASKAYLASLKIFRKGSWHDETLYRTALVIEQIGYLDPAKIGTSKPGKKTSPKTDPAGLLKNPGKRPPKRRKRRLSRAEQAAKNAKERLMKSQQRAGQYWAQLLKKYPASPYTEAALYHTGYIMYGKLSDQENPSQSEAGWQNVVQTFLKLTQDFPESGWIGDAQVKIIDIQLERLFQLDTANHHTKEAMTWLKVNLAKPDKKVSPLSINQDDPLALRVAPRAIKPVSKK